VFDWFREGLMMRKRGLKRVVIVEKDKRGSPIDVTKFLSLGFTESLEINSAAEVISSLIWVNCHIKYQSEEKDFWKFASETIVDGFGDCEDGAILLACLILSHNKLIPYYEVLVNVYTLPSGAHVAVTIGNELCDWTNPSLKRVPSDWKLWYCFNQRHAYTTKQNVGLWKKQKRNS
jgi:hypothetical protein